MALIVFAGQAFVQCPLPLDYAAVHMFMDIVATDAIGMGLNLDVNHGAFAADEERARQAEERLAADDIVPLMEVDHGWCVSLYYLDPNGIMVEFCRDTGGFGDDPGSAADRLGDTEATDVSTYLRPLDPAGLRGFTPLPTRQPAQEDA